MARLMVSQLNAEQINNMFAYCSLMLDIPSFEADLKANLFTLRNVYSSLDENRKVALEKDYEKLVERIKNI